jgi:hypothetical protein
VSLGTFDGTCEVEGTIEGSAEGFEDTVGVLEGAVDGAFDCDSCLDGDADGRTESEKARWTAIRMEHLTVTVDLI